MARSIGPILATGGITMAADVLAEGHDIDFRVPVATAVAAGAFALIEKAWEAGAVALSYLTLITVLFVRLRPGRPAPIEMILSWINGGGQQRAAASPSRYVPA